MTDVARDMEMMHDYYGVREKVQEMSGEMLAEFLKFRFRFLEEELTEGISAVNDWNAEEIVDALVDLVVVAVGTLDLLEVNFDKAWKEVLTANMNKKVGIKPGRPNPFGLPDLIKPADWVGPDHTGNHGILGVYRP